MKRVVVFWLMVILSAFVVSCGQQQIADSSLGEVAVPVTKAVALRARPTLTNPKIVTSVPSNNIIDGGGKDVLVKILGKLTKAISIVNINNAVVLAPWIELGTTAAAAITFSNIKGTAHVEGGFIDCKLFYADGIREYRSPGGTLVVQNTRIINTGGIADGIHGDIIHTQGDGPLKEFVVENVTGLTAYQGIFTPYRGDGGDGSGAKRVEMNRVSLGWSSGRPSSVKDMSLLYPGGINNTDKASPNGVYFTDVYIDVTNTHNNTTWWSRVILNPNNHNNVSGTWTNPLFHGTVYNGTGLNKDFAPRNLVAQYYDRANFETTIPDPDPIVQPDLVVTAISWEPQTPRVGDLVTFSATIKNIGQGATPSNTIHGVLFSVDGVVASWSDSHINSIAPGASVTLQANGGPSMISTWNALVGNHTVEAFVDDPNRIPNESNEINNKLSSSISVVAKILTLQAEDYNSQSGSVVKSGDVVGQWKKDDWISFNSINIAGLKTLTVSYSKGDSYNTVLEVRKGSATGELIAEVPITSTGNWGTFKNTTVNINPTSSTGNLYFVLKGWGCNADYFVFK